MTTKTGNRAAIVPEVVKHEDKTETRHPAYATLAFFSTQGSTGCDLFGANVRVANVIRGRISRAHMVSGTVDRVSEDDTILEFELTESQFTQAITQFNRGTGTPITLRQAPDIGVYPVVYPQIAAPTVDERLKANIDRRVAQELEAINKAVKDLGAIVNAEGSVSKKALQAAVRHLDIVLGTLPGNMDYYRTVMAEDVDKFLHEAKMELHASANLLLAEGAPPALILEDRQED
jgi:hypothetical protein